MEGMSRMKKWTSTGTLKTLCSTVLLLVFACSAASALAAEQALVLRLGVASEEDGPRAKLAEALIEAIGQESTGGITMELLVNSNPQGPTEIIRQLEAGTIDMALVESWALGERFAPFQKINQPLIFANRQRTFSFYYGEGGKKIAEALAMSGIRLLTWIPGLPLCILAEKPMAESADYAGARLSSRFNPVLQTAMEGLGGQYVPTPPAELSGVLSSGLADAYAGELRELPGVESPPGTRQITESTLVFPYLAVCGADSVMAKIGGGQKDLFTVALEKGIVALTQNMYFENEQARAALTMEGFEFGADDYGELLHALTPVVERFTGLSDPSFVQAVEENNAPQKDF